MRKSSPSACVSMYSKFNGIFDFLDHDLSKGTRKSTVIRSSQTGIYVLEFQKGTQEWTYSHIWSGIIWRRLKNSQDLIAFFNTISVSTKLKQACWPITHSLESFTLLKRSIKCSKGRWKISVSIQSVASILKPKSYNMSPEKMTIWESWFNRAIHTTNHDMFDWIQRWEDEAQIFIIFFSKENKKQQQRWPSVTSVLRRFSSLTSSETWKEGSSAVKRGEDRTKRN